MKTLDLRTIPSVLINLDSQPKRLASVTGRLKEVDIEFERFSGVQTDRGIVGCGLSHHQVLSQIEPGTLVFEDDVVVTPHFTPVIEVPEEADAIYLGVSNWGYVRPSQLALYESVIATQYNDDYKRVFNMCSAHAIVYLSEKFIKGAVKIAASCLGRNIPWDLGLAAIQRHFTIITPNKPFFYQEELPQYTNIAVDSREVV
jgi:GR25 family glycosyltransferase involved in LPS biosynthesis